MSSISCHFIRITSFILFVYAIVQSVLIKTLFFRKVIFLYGERRDIFNLRLFVLARISFHFIILISAADAPLMSRYII